MDRYVKFIIMVLLLTPASGFCVPQTYPIIEKDALTEIKSAAAKVNFQNHLSEEEKQALIKNYRPKGLKTLPQAKQQRSFLVDMTYTLTFDIPDGKGGILYPKGYSYNPLDYMNYYQTLVVIDGSNRDQIHWFKNSPYYQSIKARLLITDGNYYDLATELETAVFYAFPEIINKFKLTAVPVVIRQDEKMMKVTEIDIEKIN